MFFFWSEDFRQSTSNEKMSLQFSPTKLDQLNQHKILSLLLKPAKLIVALLQWAGRLTVVLLPTSVVGFSKAADFRIAVEAPKWLSFAAQFETKIFGATTICITTLSIMAVSMRRRQTVEAFICSFWIFFAIFFLRASGGIQTLVLKITS